MLGQDPTAVLVLKWVGKGLGLCSGNQGMMNGAAKLEGKSPVFPTDVNCIWAYGVCWNNGEGLVLGRMMKWEGLGSRVGLGGREFMG